MTKTANSPLSSAFVRSQPSSSNYAVVESMKQSASPIRFGKLSDRKWSNISERFENYEVADRPVVNSKAVDAEHVASLKGSKLAAAVADSYIQQFPIPVLDQKTGKPVWDSKTGKPMVRFGKVPMRSIVVLSYGTKFSFSCKVGSETVMDGRDGKRKSKTYVKSELVRLLGSAEGEAKFAELTA